MNIKELPWDSAFFHKRIAGLYIHEKDGAENLLELFAKIHKEKKYELVYVYSPKPIQVLTTVENCFLVDRKVIYVGKVNNGQYADIASCGVFNGEKPTLELEHLAWESAICSRFKVDRNFGDEYKRLYSCWMEKCVSGELADCVVYHSINGKIDGMLTLKQQNEVGDIGLIAVLTTLRNSGIGTKLINYAKNWLCHNGCTYLKVTTQLTNEIACRFYEKQGLIKQSLSYIYHYWL